MANAASDQMMLTCAPDSLVCRGVCVCKYVCVCNDSYAFRHALRYVAECWEGRRGRAGPKRFESIFQRDRTQGQRPSRGQLL